MTRVRALIAIFVLLLLSVAMPLSAEVYCNCWDGDMICTIYNPDGAYAGYMFMQDHPGC